MNVLFRSRRAFIHKTTVMCRFSSTFSDDNVIDPRIFANFKKQLKDRKIPFKDGPVCLHVGCKLCCDHYDVNAYVNKRTGLFLCPNCDIKENLAQVANIYEKTGQIEYNVADRKVTYTSQFQDLSPITQSICDNINIRGLKVPDLEILEAKYNSRLNSIHFPLKNVANKVVGEKILYLADHTEETIQTESNSGFLICGNFPQKGRAVMVATLMDYIVLSIHRSDNTSIICLPYGLNCLPQECLPCLEAFKEIVLWFKFDAASWDAAKAFSKKLDDKRCLFIRPTDSEPTPTEAHKKKLNLRIIISRATPLHHKSITTFHALKNDVLSELQNIDKVNGVKWKRFPLLNKILKGHRKGELTILTGPTGSGKTTFVSEYSLDLALQGVSTLWGSFEIRNCRLAATLLRQFVGYSLENKLNEFDYWTTAFEKYPLYFMTFHGQQPLKLVMDAVEHAQYVHDINHVIIDNLQFMMGTSIVQKTDKFWEQDAIISAFRSFATKNNIHVTLVMHPRKERAEEDLTTSSVFGSAKATQEADNVLIIQDKRLTSLRGKKYLQVVKNRYSGDLGIMPLEFDKESLSYASTKRKKEKGSLE